MCCFAAAYLQFLNAMVAIYMTTAGQRMQQLLYDTKWHCVRQRYMPSILSTMNRSFNVRLGPSLIATRKFHKLKLEMPKLGRVNPVTLP